MNLQQGVIPARENSPPYVFSFFVREELGGYWEIVMITVDERLGSVRR